MTGLVGPSAGDKSRVRDHVEKGGGTLLCQSLGRGFLSFPLSLSLSLTHTHTLLEFLTDGRGALSLCWTAGVEFGESGGESGGWASGRRQKREEKKWLLNSPFPRCHIHIHVHGSSSQSQRRLVMTEYPSPQLQFHSGLDDRNGSDAMDPPPG